VRNPEQVRELESLRLARTDLERQLGLTTNDRRRQQLTQAIEELDRRTAETTARLV
jgi:ribosomal protein L13E